MLESGPDYNGRAFLKSASTNGVRLDIINAMTMDYGHPVANMANAAKSAKSKGVGRLAFWSIGPGPAMVGRRIARPERTDRTAQTATVLDPTPTS